MAALDSEVRVADLPTYYGPLRYTLRREGARSFRVSISGEIRVPPGGIVVRPPLPGPLVRVRVDGVRLASHEPEGVTLRRVPAELVIDCG